MYECMCACFKGSLGPVATTTTTFDDDTIFCVVVVIVTNENNKIVIIITITTTIIITKKHQIMAMLTTMTTTPPTKQWQKIYYSNTQHSKSMRNNHVVLHVFTPSKHFIDRIQVYNYEGLSGFLSYLNNQAINRLTNSFPLS